MRYGNLTVFCGPMFASKTNSLIKEALFATCFGAEAGSVSINRIAFDSRTEDGLIESHDGAAVSAVTVQGVADLPVGRDTAAFFDEIQFFAPPYFEGDFVDHVRALRAAGTDVYCAGLDMDYLGRGFEVTAALMAEASRVERLTAQCATCGAPATHTSRLLRAEDRFLPGDSELYAPMCLRHWHADRLKSTCKGTA